MLFTGIIYAWSILKEPLKAEFGWGPSQLALNFTLTMCFFCIGGIVAGFLIKIIKLRLTVLVAGIIAATGFLMTAGNNGDLRSLYITYGVMCGLGIGMAYNAVISSTNAWFPDKKGVSSGTMLMGFGMSSLVLGNIANVMFGFDFIGWRATYIIIGAAIGAVLIVASFLISSPGPDVILPEPKKKGTGENPIGLELTTGQMVVRATFWKLFISLMLLSGVGASVISVAKDLALISGAGDSLAALLVGVLAVSNGLGRIICGLVFDNLGRGKAMLMAGLINNIASIAFLGALFMGSLPLCVAGICLAGLGYGCCPTLIVAHVMEFYGKKNFNLNFSIANTLLMPASMFATISNMLAQNTGSFQATFILLLCCGIFALFLSFSIKRP